MLSFFHLCGRVVNPAASRGLAKVSLKVKDKKALIIYLEVELDGCLVVNISLVGSVLMISLLS